MKRLLLTTAFAALMPIAAQATLITGFTQTSNTNTVTAVANGADTATTISISNASVNLGGGILGSIPGAVLNVSATSTNAAQTVLGQIIQSYSGSFCISSGAGCTGNFLSGNFTDAVFGAAGGPGLTLNVNNPPEALTMASNVVPAADLNPPSSFNLDFTNLNVPLAIAGTTISSFTASVAGNVSASVPEPASLGLLGLGLIGLGTLKARRRDAA